MIIITSYGGMLDFVQCCCSGIACISGYRPYRGVLYDVFRWRIVSVLTHIPAYCLCVFMSIS